MKEFIDQSAHFLIAYGLVTLLKLLGADIPLAAGALLGFALAATREVTEGGNILSNGSVLDTIFWTAGGAAGAQWSLV